MSAQPGTLPAVGAAARRHLPRLTGTVLVLGGAATLAFLILHAIPGDPVDIMLGAQSQAPEEVKERIRAEIGLDQPLLAQYLGYLGRTVMLDFGTSYRLQRPVIDVIAEQLPSTLALAGAAILIALVTALVIAVAARGRVTRAIASTLELLAISSPSFWTGLLLLTIFSFNLHWFPVSGGNGLAGLVLPAVTMALPIAGILSQLLRHGLDSANAQPFVTSVIARGVGPTGLLTRHTLRHAALPTVTLTAYIIGSLIGGAVIVEQLFSRPGLGRVTLDAISNRDLPVVMALVVLAAVVFVAINLIIDALYPILDPRLKEAR